MSSVAHASIPLHVSPSVRKALGELATLLRDYHYSEHAVGQVVAYTAREGTPTGSPYLDREDEADAEAVYVAELEPVDLASDAWDRDTSVIFDAAMLADGSHPWPIPVTGDDDPTEPDDFAAAALEDLALPPVAGGSPDDDGPAPYEPTAEDLADFGRWSEDLERRRNAAEGRSGGHDADTLERVHRALYGRSEPFHA
jgi:hypothetical protein